MDVREKLVELIRCADYHPCGGGAVRKIGSMFTTEFIEDIASQLIANGVTVQEWIPASEPPKKITNKVIVLCKNGYIGYGHYENYNGKQTWYNLEIGKPFTDWAFEDCESYEVTHWMPMPQPPKGE